MNAAFSCHSPFSKITRKQGLYCRACQNKVSADQYQVTISRAQNQSSSRSFVCLNLTATRNWLSIGSQAQATLTSNKHKPGLIFQVLSVARRGCTAILRQLTTQQWPGSIHCLTYIAVVRTTLVAT